MRTLDELEQGHLKTDALSGIITVLIKSQIIEIIKGKL